MGADIHGVIEVHVDGQWRETFSIEDLSPRDYWFFATFFGVRGRSPFPYKYRGFPEHPSWYTLNAFCSDCRGQGHREASKEALTGFRERYPGKEYCDTCLDFHSVSWMSWKEFERHIKELDEWTSEEDQQYGSKRWKLIFDTMRFWETLLATDPVIESSPTLTTGEEDTSRVRLVVWFDN